MASQRETWKTKAIYYPSYIPNCVASAAQGFGVYNDTTVARNITNGTGGTITTVQPKATAYFTAGGVPGFYFVLLGSNNHTALLAHCK